MRISDWSSDVCSSDLSDSNAPIPAHNMGAMDRSGGEMDHGDMQMQGGSPPPDARDPDAYSDGYVRNAGKYALPPSDALIMSDMHNFGSVNFDRLEYRSEEHTSELQSLMRISYAVFCLKKQKYTTTQQHR